ncbi:hypothetical protein CP98_03161 [Sphingobium yanoikuyae]|uniref:Uncharacterized protein n=1 Tax=Sphingobium yanoikuyae TaxID=13690 RepID=A0A084EI86_SPHYA|nr:hypothetical protein [Sphingobium yanoikuyae]KEZ17678.1 hypothetical protein CP98_03161 [Sphingobium yanoikuyae]
MLTTVTVRVDDVLDQLQPLARHHNVSKLSALIDVVPTFDVKASIDRAEFAVEANLVDPDNHARDVIEDMAPNLNDLRDGLTELAKGNKAMALTLLCRAFDDWAEAHRVVEDVLSPGACADLRQRELRVA